MMGLPMQFQGKVALITGGGTGIGAAVARRFVADGGQVVLMGRRRRYLQAVARPIGGAVVAGDAADAKDVRLAVAAAKKRFGGLDVLVANAGGHGVGPTVDMTDETWRQSARDNLDTAFVSAREALPSLIERKGAIVIVSSIAGLFSGPEAAGYVTMKHACIGLARSLARDYGRKGVRTNVVCPGWVSTAMADKQMEVLVKKFGLRSIAEAYALVTKDVPLGRPATAQEVANLVCFLASNEASMMNGAICTVDGGASVVDLPTLAFVADTSGADCHE
jgi:NAD(P)-dependent dehydrogenase (short-subunit alcohol dehydrogenase family)